VSNRLRPVEHTWVTNLSMLLHIRFDPPIGDAPAARLAQARDHILDAMLHRDYDYPALSEVVARDAVARGGRVSWLVGCSYVVEPRGRGPSPLFAERLDDQPGQAVSVPTGSCAFTIRQSEAGLRFSVDWDPIRWPREPAALQDEYLVALTALTGVAMPVREPA